MRRRLETPDGDFVDFDWIEGPAEAPVLVLLHGLEGSSRSHYAIALMREAARRGWRGVVPHWRGCSGEPNRLPRAYHSGDHVEAQWMIAQVAARAGGAPVYAIGVSLGGSALLNWLGRAGTRAGATLRGAAAVSCPLDLTAAGRALERGLSRVYARNFLSTMKAKSLAKARRFPGHFDSRAIRRARTLWAFDEAVTAPLHGFAGADDYWRRASSKPWLAGVRVPTLVLNARNDPFVPAWSLPHRDEVAPEVLLEQPDQGGHAGFPGMVDPANFGWLVRRLLEFLEQTS